MKNKSFSTALLYSALLSICVSANAQQPIDDDPLNQFLLDDARPQRMNDDSSDGLTTMRRNYDKSAAEFSKLQTQNELLKLELERRSIQQEIDDIENVDRDQIIAGQKKQISELTANTDTLEKEIAKLEKAVAEFEEKATTVSDETPSTIERLALVEISSLSGEPTAQVIIDGKSKKHVTQGDQIIAGVTVSKITRQSMYIEEEGRVFEVLMQAYPLSVVDLGDRYKPKSIDRRQQGRDNTDSSLNDGNTGVIPLFNSDTMKFGQGKKGTDFYLQLGDDVGISEED